MGVFRHRWSALPASALAAMLVACGGGGEDASRARAQAAPADRVVPPRATAAAPAGQPPSPRAEAPAASKSDPTDRYSAPRTASTVALNEDLRKGKWHVSQGVRALAVSADGASIAVVSGDDGVPRVLDASSRRTRLAFPSTDGTSAAAMAFTADGRFVVSAGRDSVVRVWQADTGAPRLTLGGHSQPIRTVATSADGRRIATAGEDTRVMVWNAVSGKLERVLTGHTDFVNTVAFSPDGRWLASAGADARVLVFDLASGQLVHTLRGHAGDINAVAFSPDGRWLASAGQDMRVRLWDVANGRQLAVLEGHQAPVRDVAFGPGGAMLASGDAGGQILVWDMATRQRLRQLATGGSAAINTLAFDAKDPNVLFAGGDDNRLVRWNVSAATPG